MSAPTSFPPGTFELAETLARPVTSLHFQGEGQPVAAWRGVPSVPLPEHLIVTDEDAIDDGDFFEHWISVDASRLPHPLPGCVSIYLHAAERTGVALHDPCATLSVDEGQALYGHAARQLPHLNALFRHGSPDFQAWVAHELSVPVDELFTWSDISFGQGASLNAPDQRLRTGHPMWATEQPVAELGGWCWGWPDEEWDTRETKGQQLMLVTYQDSEPWVELWWTGQEFEVIPHIT